LEKALLYCKEKGLSPLFLGDLFDSQCNISDAPAVYMAVRSSQKELGSIVLRSNHQHLLECLANKKEIPLKKDLARTVEEFRRAGICIQEVASWLETFPYIVAFRDSRGVEYRVAHAEIPASIRVPDYEGTWKYFDPTPEEARKLLWGADYSLPDWKRFWWRRKEPRDWILVAGHYHKVVNDGRSLVLDAGCGGKTRSWFDKRLPQLLLYDVEQREVVPFEVFD